MQNGILQNEFCFPTGVHYRTGDATPIKKLLQCIHIDTVLICRCLYASAGESVFSSRYGDPPSWLVCNWEVFQGTGLSVFKPGKVPGKLGVLVILILEEGAG